MAKRKPQPEILDFAQLAIRRHDATVAMLAALKVLVDPDLNVNDIRAAKQMARAAIVQAEIAGFKVPS